ncbi:MAG: MlaD family protein [Polyangiales bacterium]
MSHTPSTRALAFAAALLPLLAACESEMSARVREAGELAEGSPVTLAGVRVGEVKGIEVAGGDAPVLVRFAVEGNNQEAIAAGACSRAEGGTLVLQAGTDTPVVEGQISACEPGLLDGLRGAGELLRGAVEGVREGVQEELRQGLGLPNNNNGEGVGVDLTREAGRQAGEQIRGAAEGVREGLGDDAARALGRAVGRDAQEFQRGVQEGLDEGAQ